MKTAFAGAVACVAMTMGPALSADLPTKSPLTHISDVTGYFEMSGLAMTRSKSDSVPLFSTAAALGSGDIMRGDQFNMGWAGGAEARGVLKKGPWGVEFAWFFMGNFDDTVNFPNSQGITQAAINTTPPTGYGLGGAHLSFNYISGIIGAEANGTWDVARGVTLLAGPRYIKLHEDFSARGISNASGATFEIDQWKVHNSLLGGQIGARIDFLKAFGQMGSPWILEGNVRGGVFNNQINSTVSATGNLQSAGDFSSTAYAVQGGVGIGYRLNSNIALILAYDALWLDGVALAPSQVPVSPQFFTAGQQGLATESVLYQGAKLTLRVTGN